VSAASHDVRSTAAGALAVSRAIAEETAIFGSHEHERPHASPLTGPRVVRHTLSVLVPAFDEERTIGELLRRVLAVNLDALGVAREVIVVSDGSRDRTARIARSFAGVRVFETDRNFGKGAALRLALSHATGDLVLFQDADLEYDPRDYPALLAPLLSGRADVVFGSRLLGQQRARRRSRLRRAPGAYLSAYLGGRAVTLTANLLFGLALTDETTCYKLMPASLLRAHLPAADGFAGGPELTANLARAHATIVEVPIGYHPRSFADGKKISWRDGLAALTTLVKARLRRSGRA